MASSASAALDRAFVALADKTRRGVVERLRRGPQRAGELARSLAVSAPMLSRHLKILRDSRLVEEVVAEDDARARVYRLRSQPFAKLRGWIEEVEAMWSEQLSSFAEHVERTRGRGRKS